MQQTQIKRSPKDKGIYFVGDQEWRVCPGVTASCRHFHYRLKSSHHEQSSSIIFSSTYCTLQVGERYVLQRLLGTGTFSEVCAALDSITGETVRRWPQRLHVLGLPS